jgi:hypothetical protein
VLPVFAAVVASAVVGAAVVAVAVDGAAAGGACTIGGVLETAETTGDETGVDVAAVAFPTGAAALWFREQPVTSVARIATLATANAALQRVT